DVDREDQTWSLAGRTSGRLRWRKTERTGPVGGADNAKGRKSPMLDSKRREFIALLGGGGLLLASRAGAAAGNAGDRVPPPVIDAGRAVDQVRARHQRSNG